MPEEQGDVESSLNPSRALDVPASHHVGPRSIHTTIDSTITRPGAVRINFQGAFIVDDDAATLQLVEDGGALHDSRDIRLPHHTAVVSHVAVDVSRHEDSH